VYQVVVVAVYVSHILYTGGYVWVVSSDLLIDVGVKYMVS
jgi:hypothetical protein